MFNGSWNNARSLFTDVPFVPPMDKPATFHVGEKYPIITGSYYRHVVDSSSLRP